MSVPDDPVEELRRANLDLQQRVAKLREELQHAQAAERLIRESRWWRLGLALRNRRNIMFAVRHPTWALKTLAGLRTRRGRGRRAAQPSLTSARKWLAGVSAEPRASRDLWVAAIVDSPAQAALSLECNVMTFRPDNWQVALETRRPHFVLVESAVAGNDGAWEYRIASTAHADSAGLQDLRALTDWCRANGTPTIFWLTAPAADAERYAEAAGLFDHVVATTTSAAAVLRHMEHLRSAALPILTPGVQPKLHNPIGASQASDACAFLDEVRSAEGMDLVSAAESFGVAVYATAGTEDVPERVKPYVRFVPAGDLEQAYAKHSVYLNAQSEGLPRRALEAIACGGVVVSVPNATLEKELPGAVTFVRTPEEAKAAIEQLLSDEAHHRELSATGLRTVLAKHTIRDRVEHLAALAGFDVTQGSDESLGIVAVAEAATAQAIARSIAGRDREALIGVPAGTALSVEGVRVVEQDASQSPGERLRALAAIAATEWVVPLANEPLSGDLGMLGLVRRIADADVITGGDETAFADRPGTGIAIVRRSVVATYGWPPETTWSRKGIRFLAIAQ